MIIHAVVADTGRPAGPGLSALNLLNAGWTVTTAIPLPEGGYTLPGQALGLFIEAPWDQLNRPHHMVIELVDDEGNVAELDDPRGPQPARIEQEITIPPVSGAPNGTPGQVSFLVDLPTGTLRIPAPRRRYSWRVHVGSDVGGTGFWVNAHPMGPVIGRVP